MWDVKFFNDAGNEPFGASFYLNYVGCKVYIVFDLSSVSLSFTLTMWDVKVLDLEEGMSQYEVLP